MGIKYIQLQNFQGHKESELELHPGVNVVIGESDSGKSSIIRSLVWLTQNRPSGFNFKSNFAGPNDETIACIVFEDDSFVARVRNKLLNCYRIEDDNIFQALRSDVPDEIKEITNIRSVNIQTQHPDDQYFLLTEKPGQIAKRINAVSGLEVMDKALTEVNGQVKTVSSRISFIDTEIEKAIKKRENFSLLPSAEQDFAYLEEEETSLSKMEKTYYAVEEAVNSIKDLQGKMKNFEKVDEALKLHSNFAKREEELQKSSERENTLRTTVYSLRNKQKLLTSYADIQNALNDLSAIKIQTDEVEALKQLLSYLQTLLSQLSEAEKKSKETEKQYEKILSEYTDVRGSSVCPTCGRSGK